MAKLTKFKAQQVEFPTHYKVEETSRGDTKIKNIVPAFGTIREQGTPETGYSLEMCIHYRLLKAQI